MRVRGALVAVAVCFAWIPEAGAQDESLTVPPPPTQESAPPQAQPPPPQPVPGAVPMDVVLAPLLAAAEQDVAASRPALALARARIVAEVLPEGVPLRVRADGLRLLAEQRAGADTAAPPADEVYAPLVVQAEFEMRSGQPLLALPRLEFALARLPAQSPLAARAIELRRMAASMLGAGPPAPVPVYVPPPVIAERPAPPAEPDDGIDHRGGGEIVELFITVGMLGALTGAYIPFVATNGEASALTYTLTMLAGAGLFFVGALSIDLTERIPSGVPPTIASSIRFGFANGVLAFALYDLEDGASSRDPNVEFSLVWGGAMIGTLAGFGLGFGLTPTVREERFVESAGLWGGALGTYVALMAEGFSSANDPRIGVALMMGGLNLGLFAGGVVAALGAMPSTARTLWTDLGFIGGSGVGAIIPLLIYSYMNEPLEGPALGVGMAIGGVGGWLLTFFLTESLDREEAPAEEPRVSLSLAPLERGAALTAAGMF
jgi:hypothetical protein